MNDSKIQSHRQGYGKGLGIEEENRSCFAARSTTSCSGRLMCPGMQRKTKEDEEDDKECRRV